MEVSRAVQKARLMERALHGSGVWEMACGDIRVPASRVITEDGVVFKADFPEGIVTGEVVALLYDGQEQAVRPLSVPETAFEVEWGFATRVTTTLARPR